MPGAKHPPITAITVFAAAVFAAVGVLGALGNPVFGQDIPPEASVDGVIGHAQSYVLSCESRSASDWAAYFGFDLSENEILAALPRMENPDTGFVGSPSGAYGFIPPRSYGVHPPPLAQVLSEHGVPAEAVAGYGWEALQRQIAGRKPVIVWVIGQMWNGTPIRYTASDGQTTTVAYYEHTMILVGYTDRSVHVVDAYTGNDQYYDINTFLTSWAVLGERAIIYAGDLPEAPTPTSGPPGVYTVKRGDTLSHLASQNGLAWTDLADLNGIRYPYLLYAGQVIKIPGVQEEPAVVTSQPTETVLPTQTPVQPTSTPEPVSVVEKPGYTVRVGDTLLGLAEEFGVAWQELVQTNNLKYPYFIYPGEVLTVLPKPATPAEAIAPEIRVGTPSVPTLDSDISPDSLYTVQRGDYLADLGRRFGLDWGSLAELNSISYPYRIYPGQVLKLR